MMANVLLKQSLSAAACAPIVLPLKEQIVSKRYEALTVNFILSVILLMRMMWLCRFEIVRRLGQ